MSICAGVIVAVAFHQVDHAPHCQTSTEGNNESLQNRNCLSNECHNLSSLTFLDFGFLKMGKKIEAPSLFCFELCSCAVHDGASSSFDLSHVIEIELFSWLDYQLAGPVFFDVEGVSLIEVRQQFVFWMLRYIKLITEKRSHASKL